MGSIAQIFAISWMNLKTIPARLGSSLVVVVGIGGVVAVLIALLAMAQGFQQTLQGAGRDDRVIILRDGSNSEINGAITFQQANIISNLPGIANDEAGPLIANESYVSVNHPKRSNDSLANVPFRGVSARSFDVRPEVQIIEGRNIEFGQFEIIVGTGAASQFKGLEVGNTISLRNTDWKVVGVFNTGGSVFDSELWTDVLTLNNVFNRGSTFSSMAALLQPETEVTEFDAAMKADRRLVSKVQTETDFYSAQSLNTATLIKGVGYTVAAIMAIGAIFAVLNTMYAAVSTRSTEIATLRALGFGALPVVTSVMLESIGLALLGGALGATITYVLFNGFTASTIGANTQVSFDFMVTWEIVGTGVLLACLLGLIGGLMPSVRAARVPVVVALRGE